MNKPVIPGSLAIDFAGQSIDLLPDGAAWWPVTGSLVIADLHLGKAASFRAQGIPVPSGSTRRDLARLTALLEQTGAGRLIILGDCLHSRSGRQPEVFQEVAQWRLSHARLDILLIRGNHDRSAGPCEPGWNFREVEEPHADGGLGLVHDPQTPCDLPALAGHIHPVTSIRDYDGSYVRIPSFICDPDRLILPAFGTFTGGHCLRDQPGRRIYLAMAGRMLEKK